MNLFQKFKGVVNYCVDGFAIFVYLMVTDPLLSWLAILSTMLLVNIKVNQIKND